MWCWRRMWRIPWTARRISLSILKERGITTIGVPARRDPITKADGSWSGWREKITLTYSLVWSTKDAHQSANNRGYKYRGGQDEVRKYSASSGQHFKLGTTFSNKETNSKKEEANDEYSFFLIELKAATMVCDNFGKVMVESLHSQTS